MNGTTETFGQLGNRVTRASAARFFETGEFIPHFQPIVEFESNELVGLEVLARWRHPDFGLLAPDKFIPLAEKHGWIDTMLQRVLHNTFSAVDRLPTAVQLSVNLCPSQLQNEALPDLLLEAAAETKFPLGRITLEITESALVDNLPRALRVLNRLKALGCSISLDDFGTGFSNLRHLATLPVDEIKIDRSFVAAVTEDPKTWKIVSSILGLGRTLELRTVAEGVETHEQAAVLTDLGCQNAQGWFFGRPHPVETLGEMLVSHGHVTRVPGSRSSREPLPMPVKNPAAVRHLPRSYEVA